MVLPLTRKAATGASAARRQALSSLATIANGSTTSLTSLFIGEEFAAEVTFGTETFELIVDTGSSDTWVVETGFVCTDLSTGKTTTEAYCDFGPCYTKSSTFVAISGDDFSIEHGDGEYLTGIMGTEEVTVARFTVDQEVALVTAAVWEGDGKLLVSWVSLTQLCKYSPYDYSRSNHLAVGFETVPDYMYLSKPNSTRS
jgi:hypothetical protein